VESVGNTVFAVGVGAAVVGAVVEKATPKRIKSRLRHQQSFVEKNKW